MGTSRHWVDTCSQASSTPNAMAERLEVFIWGLTREFKVDHTVMGRLMGEDLGLKILVNVPVRQLIPAQRQKKMKRGGASLNFLQREASGKILVLSDENDFHIENQTNTRNTRITATLSKGSPMT